MTEEHVFSAVSRLTLCEGVVFLLAAVAVSAPFTVLALQLSPPIPVPLPVEISDASSIPVIAAWSGLALAVISALTGGIVSIITALKVAKIEAHVNSEKTSLDERARAKDTEIGMLREMLTEKARTADLLAQAVAQSTTSRAVTATTQLISDALHAIPPKETP